MSSWSATFFLAWYTNRETRRRISSSRRSVSTTTNLWSPAHSLPHKLRASSRDTRGWVNTRFWSSVRRSPAFSECRSWSVWPLWQSVWSSTCTVCLVLRWCESQALWWSRGARSELSHWCCSTVARKSSRTRPTFDAARARSWSARINSAKFLTFIGHGCWTAQKVVSFLQDELVRTCMSPQNAWA